MRRAGKTWMCCFFALAGANFSACAQSSPEPAPASFQQVVRGLDMGPATTKGAPEAWAEAYQMWNDAYVEIPVELPATDFYVFTLRAKIIAKGGDGALSELRLDQRPLPVGTGFSRMIEATAPRDYQWASAASRGAHKIQISLMNHDGNPRAPESLLIFALTVSAADPGAAREKAILPPEPPGRRDPRRQPFSSFSLWNTPMGAGAQWSRSDDPDTRDLRQAGAHINAGEWSMPIYLSTPGNPDLHFHDRDATYPITDVILRPPPEAGPAQPVEGGDHHMIVYGDDGRTFYSFFDCAKTRDGFACGQSQKDDACGEALGGYGWGAGVIRKWEIESSEIRHMLRYALPAARTKAGATWISGLAWPADRSDYQGPRGLYRGEALYGSTIGIPADVDLSALGLTKSGLALARALQDYGALQRDTGGEEGVIFFAESAAEKLSQLADMRADLTKIVPFLAILRNQGPDSLNGGGARRRPLAEGLDPAICPPQMRSRELPVGPN